MGCVCNKGTTESTMDIEAMPPMKFEVYYI